MSRAQANPPTSTGLSASLPQWPVTTAYGLETFYCPRCHEAEPDGLPNVEAFETFDDVMCDACAEAAFENATQAALELGGFLEEDQ